MKKIIMILSTLYLGSFASNVFANASNIFANTPISYHHLNRDASSKTLALELQTEKMQLGLNKQNKHISEASFFPTWQLASRRGTYYYFSYPHSYYPDRYYYGNPYYYYYQPGVEFYQGPSRYYYRGR